MFGYYKMDERIGAEIDKMLGQIGKIGFQGDDHGWTRLAFTPEENEVHEYAKREMLRDGFDVRVDSFGNLFGRKGPSDSKPVLIGTHLDTVTEGGNFDGVVGFIVGLLSVREAEKRGGLIVPIELAVFRAEESTRFSKACLGSRAAFGFFSPEDYEQEDSILKLSLGEAIRDCGFARLNEEEQLTTSAYQAYFETHIEQARVLATYNCLGVVTSIRAPERREFTVTGPRAVKAACAMIRTVEWICERYHEIGMDVVGTVGVVKGFFSFDKKEKVNAVPGFVEFHVQRLEQNKHKELEAIATANGVDLKFGEPGYGANPKVTGITDHSGGTPMGQAFRRDALVAAAKMVLALDDDAIKQDQEIKLKVDLRSNNLYTRACISSELLNQFRTITFEYGVQLDHKLLEMTDPVTSLNPTLQSCIEQAAESCHIKTRRIPSGAGHDALLAAKKRIPTAMIFVPSEEGLSHNPAEFTKTEDIAKAIAVQSEIISNWSPELTDALKMELPEE